LRETHGNADHLFQAKYAVAALKSIGYGTVVGVL
jgi:hypothetical protein